MNQSEQVATIHVVAYRKAPGLPVQLAVSPEVLNLAQLEKGPVLIEFRLDTRGYRFPSACEAVVFTSPGSKEAFGEVKVDEAGRVATVRGENNDGLAFAYTVSVIDEATGRVAVLDPIIQNNTP